MPLKTEAIQRFLLAKTHPDLAAAYNAGMEVQVNVGQDGGERVAGDYAGRKWSGWTDGLTTWKAFRIPWNAGGEAEYSDSEIKWDLTAHAEGIGMTGWDWKHRVSRWVAFDFDSLVGHNKGLDQTDLDNIRKVACEIPWVTVRRSTSGAGLHLYVMLEPIETKNHHEHAALARAVLGKMAAVSGLNLESKVDVCGGNMWVWHRKMLGTNGLELVKRGELLAEVPVNWRDHVEVVRGRKHRQAVPMVQEAVLDDFEQLCGQYMRVPLDETHRKLMEWLEQNGCLWWWDQDRHMLVTHTNDLKKAMPDLGIRGVFETLSTGKEKGADQNCYCFPVRNGAWTVRRHTKGVQEHASWDQDSSGWTRCYYNRPPDLSTVARAFEGVEDTDGSFVFKDGHRALSAAQALGVTLDLPPEMRLGRPIRLKTHKDRRLIVAVEKRENDSALQGWAPKKDKWQRIYRTSAETHEEPEIVNFDETVRHIVNSKGEDGGWLMRGETKWYEEPIHHIKLALKALGQNSKDIDLILGSQVVKRWTMVCKPFQPEYLGDRQWNRDAPQFKFPPTNDKDIFHHPTWDKILKHQGKGLDEAVLKDAWCRSNGLITGADYLKCWVAAMFQKPEEPLPYLFFYSSAQNTGKSTFHEALQLLLTCGYQRADNALTSEGNFNGELVNKVLCVVEETNLKMHKAAAEKIKDWVTARQLNLHQKGQTPYHIPNTTHWIQCANDHNFCPVLPGDTRITMVEVFPLDPMDLIPKRKLFPLLEKEGPDFLASLLKLEIPESNDRLYVPVVVTDEKLATQALNQTDVQRFLSEKCFAVDGEVVVFGELWSKFQEWLDPEQVGKFSKSRFRAELPPHLPVGQYGHANVMHVGNLSFTPAESKVAKLVVRANNRIAHADT